MRFERRETSSVIRVEHVTKYYGNRLTLDDISFQVAKGEIVGFLGPNAAGKTTTMRILTGYLAATRGQASIAGWDTLTHSLEARRHIGYLPETVPLYTDMTVRAYLEFSGKIRGVAREKMKRRLDEVIALCRLGEYADVLIGKLSKGFRQRVGLAQAVFHEPEVLVLDEPTVGIDPIQVSMTRELIRELGREHTILLSSHILAEVSAVCGRVVILHKGKIAAEDRIENLSARMSAGRRLRLRVDGPAGAASETLRRIRGIHRVVFEDPHHLVEFSAEEEVRAAMIKAVMEAGWTLLSLEPVEMSLEDIFLKLTSGKEEA